MQTTFNIRTSGPGLHEFTDEVVRFVRESGVQEGLLTLFVQHTSCSLCVQENADPDVRRDLNQFFRRLVPSSDDPSMQWVSHTTEGPDDMPAHIKAALSTVSLPRCTYRTPRQVVASVVHRTDPDGEQAHTITVVGSTVKVPTHSSTGCDARRSGDNPSDPFVVSHLDRPILQYDVLAVCQSALSGARHARKQGPDQGPSQGSER